VTLVRNILRYLIFILFEGQYNAGDFITVEPTKASGLVEEFGVRTTKIRALSGELIYIANGSITGVTNYVSGQQRFPSRYNRSCSASRPPALSSLGKRETTRCGS
jgi:small-conductance mechanosensitive channel